MRDYVASFPPRAREKINRIGKNLEQLWKNGHFLLAESISKKQYAYIISIEIRLPSGKRYHKGSPLYNWGISLISQENEEKELEGVSRVILAYVEDLFDQDSFEIAKELPASKILRNYYPEFEPELREIELLVDGRISDGNIPKSPLDLFEVDFNAFVERISQRFVPRRPRTKAVDENIRSKVFLVHGRDNEAEKAMKDFLNSIEIEVLEWNHIISATGNPNAFILDIIEKGFELAQAIVVLMTPDDKGMLREKLWKKNEHNEETELKYRPRQNVVCEAGMALGIQPRRTVLVELGRMILPSDLTGMHTVRMNNSEEKRRELASKLQVAQCIIDITGDDWLEAGNFENSILFE